MSKIYYCRPKMDSSNGDVDGCNLIIGNIHKKKLLQLINSKDPTVSLVEPKCRTKREFINNIKYKGTILRDRVYCEKCNTILKCSKGSTSHLAAHCKLHTQFGDGYTHDEYLATKRYFPEYLSESDNPVFNVPRSKPVHIEGKINVPHMIPVHIEGKITTDTIKSWKEQNMLPPEPPLSIRRVYNIKDDGGNFSALVKWNDPSKEASCIPQQQLRNYYIYDPIIRYEDSSDEEEKSSAHIHKHLSHRQIRTMHRMKDERHHRQNVASI